MSKWSVIRDKDGNAITLECNGEPVLHIYTTMLANQRADEIARWLNDYERLRATLKKTKQYIMNGYELGYIDDREGYTEALVREIDKALSTTNDKKDDLWWMLECPKSEPCYCKEECVYSKKYRRDQTMTRDEIITMKPGRELNALIAEKVMGWRKRLSNGFEYWDGEGDKPWVDNWSPSTDIAAALEVATHLQKQGYCVCIELLPHEETSVGVYEADPAYQIAYAKSNKPTEAICKAALLAVMDGEDEHERN